MNALIKTITTLCLALVLPAQAAFAQERPAQQDRPTFRQEQLDQMLAPIALHPDPLLSQILMAATYPLEVVQAARWSRANPNLKGEAAVKAVESRDWDPSVRSLVAFPEVLAMMDEHIEWTERLGEAFLAQQAQVMDTIQGLRQRAEAAGNLQPNERRAVRRHADHIVIEPPEPGVVYVPYYDPTVVYGPWWWSAYPPVYWGPPLGYYAGWGPGFWWGGGVHLSAGFFFGAFSWPHRHVVIVHHHHHRALLARRGITVTARGPVAWRHDVFHRRGVPYRQAVLRQEFRQTRTSGVEARRTNDPAPAPVTRPAQGDRAREQPRDRRSEQRVEPAPRQLRQDAPTTGVAPRSTGRTEAPAANRTPEVRRGVDAPAARGSDVERRDAPRIERNTRGSERSELNRSQQRASRSDDARRPARGEHASARERVVTEERGRGRHASPSSESRPVARAERSSTREAVTEERSRGHRASPSSESRRAARGDRERS